MYKEENLREALLNQHKTIYENIIAGDANSAADAAAAHIEFIETITSDIKRKNAWQEVSQQRLALREG